MERGREAAQGVPSRSGRASPTSFPLNAFSIDVASIFKSTHHPGGSPWGLVYTRFLARPLAACTLPLMIGATTSALLGQPVWAYLVWGLPAALVLATVWTHFSMARTLAEVGLRPGQAAFRSVYDVLLDRSRDWEPIFDVRTTSWDTELSVGRTAYTLRPNRWPKYDALQDAARQSFRPQRATTSPA